MPRRLDPKKGLPGLFAPGRPKAAEMAFLVEAPRAPASAVETPPTPRKRKPRAVEALAPARQPVAEVPDYIRNAPPFHAVRTLPAEREPLRLAEIPGFVACSVSWIVSALRT